MTGHYLKRCVLVTLGFTLAIVGLLLAFFPGPWLITCGIGLGILSTQFEWAKRFLVRFNLATEKIQAPFRRFLPNFRKNHP